MGDPTTAFGCWLAGSGSSVCQSKGLSAAAEYMACRATVGELLQRINSQKAAGTGPSSRSPATSTGGAGTVAGAPAAAAAAAAAAGDTVFSRDGRQTGVTAAAGKVRRCHPGKLLLEQIAPSSRVLILARCSRDKGKAACCMTYLYDPPGPSVMLFDKL
jgi:hypothetical protein